MNMDLDLIIFKANMRDFTHNPDDLLLRLFSTVDAEYWITYVLYYAYFDKTNAEKAIEYYTNLIDQVASLSEDHEYTESQIQLYKEYVKIYLNIDNEEYDISITEELSDSEYSLSSDKYIQFMLKYNLLLWYTNMIYAHTEYLTKLRALVTYLEDHKAEYDKLVEIVNTNVRGE